MPDQANPTREASYADGVARLIAVKTVFNPDDRSAFDSLHDVMKDLFPHLWTTCPPRAFEGALLFHWKGASSKNALALMSHQDVVDAKPGWTREPFGHDVSDGRVWGRGALDIKGNLFCILQAADELIESGFVPRNDVYLITSDREEIGGNELIADYLRAQQADIGLLVDEGSAVAYSVFPETTERLALVSVAEKGSANFKCITRGKAGHGMNPGHNTPLVRLGAFIVEIDRHGLFHEPIAGSSRLILDAAARAARKQGMTRTARAIGAVLSGDSPVPDDIESLFGATAAFTMAQGSEHPSVLPTEAWAVCNVRLAPGRCADDAETRLREIGEPFGVDIELMTARDPSPLSSAEGAHFERVRQAASVAYPGVKTLPYLLAGGTDCKHFLDVAKTCLRFTALEIDPDQQSTIHGADENLRIDTIPHGVDFFKALIADEGSIR